MSDLSLFEIEQPAIEWEPVFHPPLPAQFTTAMQMSQQEWTDYRRTYRCRDCGRAGSFNQGGASNGLSWEVCNDCAQASSSWTSDADRPALIEAQARRRAKYLKEIAA